MLSRGPGAVRRAWGGGQWDNPSRHIWPHLLKLSLPYAVTQGSSPRETHTWAPGDVYKHISTAQSERQANCPSIGKWVSNLSCV